MINFFAALIIHSLSDVEEGGETHFNKLGLSVKPKKGKALGKISIFSHSVFFSFEEEISNDTVLCM